MVQRFDDDFAGDDLQRLRGIAEEIGIRDPAQTLSFKKGEDETSRASGRTIYVGTALWSYDAVWKDRKKLFSEGHALKSKEEIRFILGHELSHYRWGDTWHPWFNSMTGTGLALALLGNYVGGGVPALVGGVLSFGGELLAGGGLVNALGVGLTTAGMLGLGPLGRFFGGTVGGLVGSTLGGVVGLPTISNVFEIKSDLHSAWGSSRQELEGGIKRFEGEMRENEGNESGMPTLLKHPKNTLFDPLHPPLTLRVAYLNAVKWFK